MAVVRVVGIAVTVGLVLSACGGGDSAQDESSPTQQTSSTSTTESTTTTADPATTTPTTPSAEQAAYDEQIALAEQLMGPIRGLHSARNACLEDPDGCDRDAVRQHIAGESMELVFKEVDELQAESRRLKDTDDNIYFVRHRLDGEDPLRAAVWTCVAFGYDSYVVDGDSNVVSEEQDDRGYGLDVYEVVEQADGSLAVEQIVVLGEDDEQPEGGTCEAYEEWPPPRP